MTTAAPEKRDAVPSGAPRRPARILATSVLASSLAFIDGSVVNVGLPAIGHSLHASAAGLQWVVNAYMLPLSALLLLGGAAGDRYGRRRLLIFGIILFALASAACAVAPDLATLLAGRFAQGAGAAMLMPNSLALLGEHFTGEAKGRAIGIWAATGAAASAAGPVLGGWLIDVGNWRFIFLINLPLAAAAIVLARLGVPPDDVQAGRALDWPGGVLVTLGLAALTFGLTIGSGPGGWNLSATAAAVVAALAIAGFVAVERSRGDRAMMPLNLFASRNFVALSMLTLLLYGALGGLFVLLPYVLIEAGHYRGTAAGAALLPATLALAVLSPVMGSIAGRTGGRAQLGFGPLIVAAGFALAVRVTSRADYVNEVLPAVLVIAIGMSGAVAPLTTAVLTSVDERHVGSASGFNSAIARTGGLIATALLGTVLAAHGPAILAGFHAASWVGAAMCVLASANILVLMRK